MRNGHCNGSRGFVAAVFMTLGLATPAASAHEYWIAPRDYMLQAGDQVGARLMVGEMLKGTELPWLSHQVRSFSVATPAGLRELDGMEGDLPAVTYVAREPGLHVIAQETRPLTVTFDSLDEFREYLDYEGLGEVAEAHVRRGLPERGFVEAYSRAAKALVQVGPVRKGEGDRSLGLAYELIARANPYAGGDTLTLQLLWEGAPAAGAPVALLRGGDGTSVERLMFVSDADGRVEIPLVSGARHLISAVHIEPVEGEEHVWASTWASLSFAVPANE